MILKMNQHGELPLLLLLIWLLVELHKSLLPCAGLQSAFGCVGLVFLSVVKVSD